MQRDRESSGTLRIVMTGWLKSDCRSPKSQLEKAGHVVSTAPNASGALKELLEKDFDILLSRVCCQEDRDLISMCKSIRPNCKRIVTTLWGRLLDDSAIGLCDVDCVLPDRFSAEELTRLFDTGANHPECI